jgi:hypothetical protein
VQQAWFTFDLAEKIPQIFVASNEQNVPGVVVVWTMSPYREASNIPAIQRILGLARQRHQIRDGQKFFEIFHGQTARLLESRCEGIQLILVSEFSQPVVQVRCGVDLLSKQVVLRRCSP